MTKYVYYFDEGNKEMKALLGGKGANLAEMTSLKIPVPQGFTISTDVCDYYYKNDKTYPKTLQKDIKDNLAKLEKDMNTKFGDKTNPLLVSVRSGAAVSMPGMMDTVLNLGLNDESVQGLATKTGNKRFAYDAYRRFINMFGDVVLGVEHKHFEAVLDKIKGKKGVEIDTELDADDMQKVVDGYKEVIKNNAKKDFPQDPIEQLMLSIGAVIDSWNNPRAIAYRRINNIKGLVGTAVNIQAMVFGNRGDTSGTGVAFTRDPSTGENKFYGEYLINAQGEDVVAGIRTPLPISKLKEDMPEVYKELEAIYKKLESHYKDMQDLEFTVQEGKLYMLQTRTGKRTAAAAVRTAVDMVNEGLIDEKTAILRIDPNQLNQLLHKQLDPIAKKKAEKLAKGLPASPGAAVGEVVFTAKHAVEEAKEGKKVILVRNETSPEDIEGMNVAQGFLTAKGGMTSHAAVVARGMGKCCVAGCNDINVDEKAKQFTVKDRVIKEGDYISLDGTEGIVYKDKVPTVDPELGGNFEIVMKWADKYRKLKIRTNADTPHDSEKARSLGAEGIGLCRTEHMFFEGKRIQAVREMIVASSKEEREKALAKLLPFQKEDFLGIYKAMTGLPVTIRLLDPPLHEFLPKEENDIEAIAKELNITAEKLKTIINQLHELNPMLGFRGCRLGMVYPEITEMQVKAIIEAAIEANKAGSEALPEIEIPVTSVYGEVEVLSALIRKTADAVIKKAGTKVKYKVGTMIELPRACLTADEMAKDIDFMSFGTNDLTQTTFGYSRDDSGRFIPVYVDKGLLPEDPFQVIDRKGVGKLMKMCFEAARKVNPKIEMAICGEHGGEPNSVEFCHELGLDYVSCSPFRVPIARLAAAQAVLKEKK